VGTVGCAFKGWISDGLGFEYRVSERSRNGMEPNLCNFLHIWTRSLALLVGRVNTSRSHFESSRIAVIFIT
jgi:hypothetical protein